MGILDDLAERVARAVRSQTFGQIRSLGVELSGHDVVIRGRAPSYYVKQLAQCGALDVLGSVDRDLVNRIEVERAAARPHFAHVLR